MKVLKVVVKQIQHQEKNRPWVKLLVHESSYPAKLFYLIGNLLDHERKIKITGREITATGDFGLDPRYPNVFKAATIHVIDINNMYEVLTAGMRFDKTRAKAIIKAFGEEGTKDALINSPEKLLSIPGIDPVKMYEIYEKYRIYAEKANDLSSSSTLDSLSTSSGIKRVLVKKLGSNEHKQIKSDPYCINYLDGITGLCFKTIDEFGLNSGIKKTDNRRIRAGLFTAMTIEGRVTGNTAVTMDSMLIATSRLLGIEVSLDTIMAAVRELCEIEKVIDYCDGSYSTWINHNIENNIYDMLSTRSKHRVNLLSEAEFTAFLDRLLDQLKDQGIVYFSDEQLRAIELANTGIKTFAFIGGAGTGKTTTLKALAAMYREVARVRMLPQPIINGTALAGVAAARMRQATSESAETIHSLLSFTMGTLEEAGPPRYDEKNPIQCDVLFIDECTMINSSLFCMLLSAISPNTRIIMTGDPYQLPPIGEGNTFHDIIKSFIIPFVKLEKIWRHDSNSVIPLFAAAIKNGSIPDKYMDKWSDWQFISAATYISIQKELLSLVMSEISNIHDPLRDLQILTPMVIGNLGTDVLNNLLQSVFNPKTDDCVVIPRRGRQGALTDVYYQAGDKVVHTKNRYMLCMDASEWLVSSDPPKFESKIYNGTIGIIRSIEGSVFVEYSGGLKGNIIVEYDWKDLGSLVELAYAMSVHKYQGSEAKRIVIPIHGSQTKMLNTLWLYTAITRARVHVTIIGQPAAFEKGCTTFEEVRRSTVFQRIAG